MRILFFIALLILSAGCGRSPEKLIVGKWAKSSNPYVEFFEFFEDGKIMDPSSGRVGSYTFLDDNRVRVILDSVAIIYDEVEITDNRFSFTGKTQNGLRSSFVRYSPKKSERENSQTNDKIGAEKFAKKYIEVCALKDANSAWMMLTPNAQNIINGIASSANSFADSDEKSSGKEIHIQDTDDPAKVKYDLIPRVNEKNVFKWISGTENEGELYQRYVIKTQTGWKVDWRPISAESFEKDDVSSVVSKFQSTFAKAKKGDPKEQNEVGRMYYYGEGVRKDVSEAFKWFKQSSYQNFSVAQYNVGRMYYNGEGVRKDVSEGFKWMKKAADQNYSSAQNFLGWAYYTGAGVGKNFFEGFRWYKKAVDHKYSPARAKYDVGWAYYNGAGVRKDISEGFKWMKKAAEQGYEKAIEWLEKNNDKASAKPIEGEFD